MKENAIGNPFGLEHMLRAISTANLKSLQMLLEYTEGSMEQEQNKLDYSAIDQLFNQAISYNQDEILNYLIHRHYPFTKPAPTV